MFLKSPVIDGAIISSLFAFFLDKNLRGKLNKMDWFGVKIKFQAFFPWKFNFSENVCLNRFKMSKNQKNF